MSYRHRKLKPVRKLNTKKRLRAYRDRQLTPGDHYSRVEDEQPVVFQPTRRHRRQNEEMDRMVAGTSGRNGVMA